MNSTLKVSGQIAVSRTVPDLRAQVKAWRAQGLTIGLVPTMGALHEGHLSLVRLALKSTDRTVVSIFVNPTQFGPNEDFAEYPRQFERDLALLEAIGAHLVWAPSTEEMYPQRFATDISVGAISEPMEGVIRPGHFEGVATVVAKLLLQCLPDAAVFGQKDYQQLCVIRRLVDDLDIPASIIGAPTVRDQEGLALSSRNAYLDDERLAIARRLNKTLFATAEAIAADRTPVATALGAGLDALHDAGFDAVDYFDLRHAETLAPLEELHRPARLLAAVRLGSVRLIDNIAVD